MRLGLPLPASSKAGTPPVRLGLRAGSVVLGVTLLRWLQTRPQAEHVTGQPPHLSRLQRDHVGWGRTSLGSLGCREKHHALVRSRSNVVNACW